MSDPAPDPAKHLQDPLLCHVADRIAPLFVIGSTSMADARATAISALTAYKPQSRADFVNIARILAFSLASLAALGLAAVEDLPPAQKIRYFGRANALNRSADQAERMMLRRRQDPRPAKPVPADGPTAKTTPTPPQDNAAVDAAIDEAMAHYRAIITPSTERQTAPRGHTQGKGFFTTHVPSQRSATPYRQTLLSGSAMPRLAGIRPGSPPA